MRHYFKHIPLYPSIFFLICWVCLTLQMGIFMKIILPARSWHYCFFLTGADALCIIFPFALLTPKWRPCVGIPVLFSTIFTITNALYFHFFTDLIFFPDYLDAGAYNKFTFTSGFAEWSSAETLMLIFGLIPVGTLIALWSKIRSVPFTLLSKWSIAGLTLIYFILQQCNLSYIRHQGFNLKDLTYQFTNLYEHSRLHSFKYRAQNRYVLDQFLNLFNSYRVAPLSQSEKAKAESYIALRRQRLNSLAPLAETPDSLLFPGIHRYSPSSAENKNLILIVIESWSSRVLKEDFGQLTPMPFLRSLMLNDSTLTFSNVKNFAGIGRSNDGNLIYDTGLIPLDYKNTLFSYSDADYPSLAKALKRHSVEYIADDPAFYYHIQTNKSFGYDSLVSSWYEHIPAPIEDMNLAKVMLKDLTKLPQPFFAKMETIVMHHPYNSNFGFPPLPAATGDYNGSGEVNYLQRCLATDQALKYFIDELKKKGLYQNSVIVLASDHEPTLYALEHDFPYTINFMILNSGFGGNIDTEVRQVDLFTSILDLFDRRSYFWPGTGQSIFRKNPKDIHSEKQNRDMSALLIDHRYFN